MSELHFSPWAATDPSQLVAIGSAGPRRFADLWLDVQRATALLPIASTVDDRCSEVLVACTDRYQFAVALLATWSRGHAAALPPSHRAAVLEGLAAGERVVATLHDGEASFGFDLHALGESRDPSGSRPFEPIGAATHLVTLYTSGSTGAPRPSIKLARQLLGEVETLFATFGGEPRRFLSSVPPRHIYGLLFGLLLPLRAGAAFVRETPLYADTLLELVRRHAIDTLVGVPAHLQGLEGASREALGPLRRVFSSGAPLRKATFDALLKHPGLSVIEILGSTETGGIGYRTAPDAAFTTFPGVGVAAAEDGRLLLRSPLLAPELSQPHVFDDRIEVVSDHTFRHLGRTDDIVKVGGTRASLGAIESLVRDLPGVRDVAVLAREVPGARGQEILLAAVADDWDAARMRSALSPSIDALALPRRFRFVAELPREPSGKLRRDALLSLFEEDAVTQEFERGAVTHAGEHVHVEVRVPASLVYFRGHFAQWPVLPGVTQLGLLGVGEAQRAWPDLRALRRVRRLKFKRPIEPGQLLDVHLTRIDETRIDFRIEQGAELHTSGSLFFARAEAAPPTEAQVRP